MNNQPCPRCGKQNPADAHSCTPPALRLAERMDCVTDDDCGECTPCCVAAELRRLHVEVDLQQCSLNVSRQMIEGYVDWIRKDEALLRQALRLLDFYGACYGVAKSDMPTITALRERLGESA